MNKKIIILLISCLLICGCDVKSNVVISKDLSVKESVAMSGTTSFFNNYYKSLPITVLNKIINVDPNKELLDNNGYNYHIDKEGKYPSFVAEKKFLNLNEYVNSSVFKSFYFRNFETKSNDNLITIIANDFIVGSEVDDEDRYNVSICTYSIKLPFVVKENNADKIDKKTNTYSWFIDDKTINKEIKLTFDKNKIYIYNLSWYISLVIIIILLCIMIIYIIKKVIKNKRNNALN